MVNLSVVISALATQWSPLNSLSLSGSVYGIVGDLVGGPHYQCFPTCRNSFAVQSRDMIFAEPCDTPNLFYQYTALYLFCV